MDTELLFALLALLESAGVTAAFYSAPKKAYLTDADDPDRALPEEPPPPRQLDHGLQVHSLHGMGDSGGGESIQGLVPIPTTASADHPLAQAQAQTQAHAQAVAPPKGILRRSRSILKNSNREANHTGKISRKMGILQWLQAVGFPSYAAAFAKNGITTVNELLESKTTEEDLIQAKHYALNAI